MRDRDREGQRPTEGQLIGPNRDRRSHKMGWTGLGPFSVRSSKLFGSGRNNFLKDRLFNTGPLSTLSHVFILSPVYSVMCLFSLLIPASPWCVSAWTLRL